MLSESIYGFIAQYEMHCVLSILSLNIKRKIRAQHTSYIGCFIPKSYIDQTLKWTIELDLIGYKWPFIQNSLCIFVGDFSLFSLCYCTPWYSENAYNRVESNAKKNLRKNGNFIVCGRFAFYYQEFRIWFCVILRRSIW